MPDPIPRRSASRKMLAAIFAVSGVLHLVAPGPYDRMVPTWLPRRRWIVYASGIVELVCAGGLAVDAPWAGPATAATLVAVWPANIQMALDASAAHASPVRQIVLWLRVPLQLPLLFLTRGA